jgi:alpha/beta superfamily hydrolase
VASVPGSQGELRNYNFDFLRTCDKPKLFISGSRDQFGPRPRLEAVVQSFADPKKLVIIEGADHFFEGRLREMREQIELWVGEMIKHLPREGSEYESSL